MKAKIIDGEVKIFDQVPKVWKTDSSIIVNFSNKSSATKSSKVAQEFPDQNDPFLTSTPPNLRRRV